MNKVDELIKRLLMRYPTLYHNRFEAFSEVMHNSCFGWDENGCVMETVGPAKLCTKKEMLQRFHDAVKEQKEKSKKDPDCLRMLNKQYLVNAKRELADAQFVADNIDVYAQTWCGSSYNEHNAYFTSIERRGFETYGVVNNKPDNVDEEWRKAIYDWFHHMLPTANSYMGWFDEKQKTWVAVEKHAKLFNWLREKWQEYQSPEELQKAREFSKIVDKILNEN